MKKTYLPFASLSEESLQEVFEERFIAIQEPLLGKTECTVLEREIENLSFGSYSAVGVFLKNYQFLPNGCSAYFNSNAQLQAKIANQAPHWHKVLSLFVSHLQMTTGYSVELMYQTFNEEKMPYFIGGARVMKQDRYCRSYKPIKLSKEWSISDYLNKAFVAYLFVSDFSLENNLEIFDRRYCEKDELFFFEGNYNEGYLKSVVENSKKVTLYPTQGSMIIFDASLYHNFNKEQPNLKGYYLTFMGSLLPDNKIIVWS